MGLNLQDSRAAGQQEGEAPKQSGVSRWGPAQVGGRGRGADGGLLGVRLPALLAPAHGASDESLFGLKFVD